MDVNSVNPNQINLPQQNTYSSTEAQVSADASTMPSIEAESAAVYEPSDQDETVLTDTGYKVNMKKVKAMKADTDQRMVDLFKKAVQSGIYKQVGGMKHFIELITESENIKSATPQADGSAYIENFNEIFPDLSDDNKESFDFEITEANVAKAKADIAEDGYWGAEAVSDRFLEFAIALSGGDRSKSNLLMQAIKDGYKAAEDIWGSELPQLSKDTLALTIEKFEAWRDGEDIAQPVQPSEA